MFGRRGLSSTASSTGSPCCSTRMLSFRNTKKACLEIRRRIEKFMSRIHQSHIYATLKRLYWSCRGKTIHAFPKKRQSRWWIRLRKTERLLMLITTLTRDTDLQNVRTRSEERRVGKECRDKS